MWDCRLSVLSVRFLCTISIIQTNISPGKPFQRLPGSIFRPLQNHVPLHRLGTKAYIFYSRCSHRQSRYSSLFRHQGGWPDRFSLYLITYGLISSRLRNRFRQVSSIHSAFSSHTLSNMDFKKGCGICWYSKPKKSSLFSTERAVFFTNALPSLRL